MRGFPELLGYAREAIDAEKELFNPYQ